VTGRGPALGMPISLSGGPVTIQVVSDAECWTTTPGLNTLRR